MGGSLEKGTFFAIRWQDLPWEEVRKGISRKVALKDRLMLIMYRFGPFLVWPEETHEAEQGGYVIKGKLELNLPSRGEKILISAGEGYLIESNFPHFWCRGRLSDRVEPPPLLENLGGGDHFNRHLQSSSNGVTSEEPLKKVVIARSSVTKQSL